MSRWLRNLAQATGPEFGPTIKSMTTASENRLAGLIEKIDSREARIGIIGMGYVGLPLTLLFSAQRFRVTGFDVDLKKVTAINSGRSYIVRIPATQIVQAQAAGFRATSDYAEACGLGLYDL